MNLSTQRRIAAELMNCPEKRVFFSPDKLVEIKAAITRADLRGLISKNVISKKQPQGSSRGRIRINLKQKRVFYWETVRYEDFLRSQGYPIF